jgi:hypothetical protein
MTSRFSSVIDPSACLPKESISKYVEQMDHNFNEKALAAS